VNKQQIVIIVLANICYSWTKFEYRVLLHKSASHINNESTW